MIEMPLVVVLHCALAGCKFNGRICRLHRIDVPTNLFTETLGRTFYEGYCGRELNGPECPDGEPAEPIPC